MSLLFEVLMGITLPIILMIGGGFILQRLFSLDVATLNRVVVYGTLPCLLIVSLASAPLPVSELEILLVFSIGQFVALLALGWIVAVVLRVPAVLRPVVALAAPFANAANYGIPLVELALGPEWVPYQAIITAVGTVLIFILAPLILQTGSFSLRRSAGAVLRAPVLSSVIVGLLLNIFDVPLPRAVAFPLSVVGAANTPVALIALGAMLATATWPGMRRTAGLGVALRLGLAPLATWIVVSQMTLPTGLAGLFLIGAGAPIGILLPILCKEYGREPGAASAMVMASTVLSPLVVTVMVYGARAL